MQWPPAAAAAELLARDRQHLDAGLRELGVGRLVSLVGDDDAGLEATTLLPSSHWFRSASNSSPPVVTSVRLSIPSASVTSSRNGRSDTSAWTPVSPPGRNRIGVICVTTGSYSVATLSVAEA